MMILRPVLITSPSSKRSLSVNKQKIAQVGEFHTPQNTSVRGEQNPLSPKATDHPETDNNNLTFYTQNVHGLRANEEKLEYLIRKMEEKKIDAFMIQETHLEGDYIKILPRDFMMIHHGPETKPCQGAKGGVAIILSPGMTQNWK